MKNRFLFGKDVFVHERAYLAGEVVLGDGANVWPGASIRGDLAAVYIGRNSNIQDNATVHVGYNVPVSVGDFVTVGHNAVVHGCKVGNHVMIGMGAVILDGAEIGDGAIIGAGALIPQNRKIPAGSIVVGNPYRILRAASEKDAESVKKNAECYVLLAREYEGENRAEILRKER